MQAAYNARGMATSVTNVNRGTTTIVPNALGEVSAETTAKGQTRSFVYDALGRLTSRSEPEGTSTWTWGTSAHNGASAKYIGGLKSVSGPVIFRRNGATGLSAYRSQAVFGIKEPLPG
jgi:YD repeat-containing protein